jgi:hypothetical protein
LGDHRNANLTDDDSSNSDFDSENIPPNNSNSKRLEGPWVFRMCWRYDSFLEKCFFVVERQDRTTLIPIIEKDILPGTTIVSDEWKPYKFHKI